MSEMIRSLCALCAMAAICEQAAGSGPFERPVRFLTGMEIAFAALGILKSVRPLLEKCL